MRKIKFKIDIVNTLPSETQVVLFGTDFTKNSEGSGAEIQTNGGFELPSGGWYNAAGTIINPIDRIMHSGSWCANLYYLYQHEIFTGNILTPGRKYIFSANWRYIHSGAFIFQGGTFFKNIISQGINSFEFTAITSRLRIYGGYQAIVDDVSIKESGTGVFIITPSGINQLTREINAGAFKIERLTLTGDSPSALSHPIELIRTTLTGRASQEKIFPIDKFGGSHANHIVTMEAKDLNHFVCSSSNFMKIKVNASSRLSLVFEGMLQSTSDVLKEKKKIEYYE